MAIRIRNMPDEILVEILGKLPKKDLKRARLACSLWSTAGAKWMFQRVYFAPRKAPLKIFTDIAANPAFAPNVKELIYDGRLFLPELGNFGSYWQAFSARMWEEFDICEDHLRRCGGYGAFLDEVYQDSIWNMENLGAGDHMDRVVAGDSMEYSRNVANSLVRYARLLDQQESIFEEAIDFKVLSEGLKSFRNINKVSALVDFAHYSEYCLHTEGLYIEPHEWYSSRSRLEFGLTVPPSRWCRRPRSQDGGEQDQEERIKWDVRGVQSLFRAISTHCPSLKELHIASKDDKAPMTIFQLANADTARVRTMFRYLTTLTLHPYVTKSDDGFEYAKQRYCLGLLLQESKELRILSLSGWLLDDEEVEESDDESESFGSSEHIDFGIFVGKVWPHLSKLILREARMKGENLMSIIRAQRGSLRDLILEGISLLDKVGWTQFGKEMGQLLKLNSVEVSRLYDEVIETSFSSWLLGEPGHTFIRDLMHWTLPNLLEIDRKEMSFMSGGVITGRLKADSS